MAATIDQLKQMTETERKQQMRWTRRKAHGRKLTEEEKRLERDYRTLKERPLRHSLREMSW